MSNDWLLRWSPSTEPEPRIVLPAGAGASITFDQSEDLLVVFNGYLFERQKYLPDPAASPAACVAQAYRRCGDALFDRLRGGFALAIWDRSRRRLLAGRDAMGLHPFWYFWDGSRLLISPDIDGILDQPQVRGDVNRVVMAEYLMGLWEAQQRSETFYEEIQRLPSAHCLSLEHGHLAVHRYWDPLPLGFQWATQEELDTFPEVFQCAVSRCLDAGADSIALSGGYDSVSIAVLASELLKGKRPLHAVSLHFNILGVDEGETQKAVAHALGIPQIIRKVDECMDDVPFVEASLALSRFSPLPVLSQWQAMYSGLLRSAHAAGLSKLMLGTGGDEMFHLDMAYGADLLSSFDLPGLSRYYRAMVRSSPFSPYTVGKVVFWDGAIKPIGIRCIRKVLENISSSLTQQIRRKYWALPPWIGPDDAELRQVLLERRLNPVDDPVGKNEGEYVRKMRGLLLSPLMMAEQEQGESWARGEGFLLLTPYLDRDVVELALRIHPEHLISGGRVKSPIRRFVAERLKGVELPKKKIDFTQPVHGLLRRYGLAAWRELGSSKELANLGIVSSPHVSLLMEDYFAGRNHSWIHTWDILSAETWLRARRKTSIMNVQF